jgi:hypothetical protein
MHQLGVLVKMLKGLQVQAITGHSMGHFGFKAPI